MRQAEHDPARYAARLNLLIESGLMLAMSHDPVQLLQHMLSEGRRLLNCDGGTVYLVTEQQSLRFTLRTRADALPAEELPLYMPDGMPDERYVSTWAALHNQTVLIDDIYQETRFDLSGTRRFDAQSQYRTISMLTVPLTPRGGTVLGVVQFMNAQDPLSGAIIPFAPDLAVLVEVLAAQAAVALDNLRLLEAQKRDTERRLAQERMLAQQSRLAAMGEMIGNIAHQWRQPLNILSLSLANIREVSKQSKPDEAMLERLYVRSNQTIQRMSATIDDFLNFFRPNKERQLFDLTDCIADVIGMVGAHYRHDKLDILLEPQTEPACCRGYPNEFAQVVLNALSNAKEAILARHAGGEIRIGIHRQADRITVVIGDNGGGMPPEVLDKAFDPYFTTKASGTGIGLYMSKTIVHNMGGDIALRNTEEGAEVLISIPLEKTP